MDFIVRLSSNRRSFAMSRKIYLPECADLTIAPLRKAAAGAMSRAAQRRRDPVLMVVMRYGDPMLVKALQDPILLLRRTSNVL